jgi:hypothetical protein
MLMSLRRSARNCASGRDAPGGRLDQAIEHSYHGRFARPGQTHDDENFAGFNREAGVEHADGAGGLGQDVLLAGALANQVQSGFRLIAEDFEDLVDDDLFCHGVVLPRSVG